MSRLISNVVSVVVVVSVVLLVGDVVVDSEELAVVVEGVVGGQKLSNPEQHRSFRDGSLQIIPMHTQSLPFIFVKID